MGDRSRQAEPSVDQDFEAWAKVKAQLLGRSSRDTRAILEGLGLADCWAEIDGQWTRRLSEELVQGPSARLDRFGQLCLAELERRASFDDTTVVLDDLPAEHPHLGDGLPPTDFRRQLMQGLVRPQRAPATDGANVEHEGAAHSRFIDKLAPPNANLQPPTEGQAHTASSFNEETQAARAAASAVLDAHGWPVERYAQLCGELEAKPAETERIGAAWGLHSPVAIAAVHQFWTKKLADDPSLHARWAALVAQYRESFHQGR